MVAKQLTLFCYSPKKMSEDRFDYVFKFIRNIVKSMKVKLPVTSSGVIDFEIIDLLISGLKKKVLASTFDLNF